MQHGRDALGYSLVEAERRPHVSLPTKCGSGRSERAGDDEPLSRAGTAATRYPGGVPESCHRQHEALCAGRIAASNRHLRLGQAFVDLEHVFELNVRRRSESDDQSLGRRARGGQVAQVDGCRPPAEVAPRQPVEPEVNTLNERVLGDDQPPCELRRIVLDSLDEPPSLELGKDRHDQTEVRMTFRLDEESAAV